MKITIPLYFSNRFDASRRTIGGADLLYYGSGLRRTNHAKALPPEENQTLALSRSAEGQDHSDPRDPGGGRAPPFQSLPLAGPGRVNCPDDRSDPIRSPGRRKPRGKMARARSFRRRSVP